MSETVLVVICISGFLIISVATIIHHYLFIRRHG